jgi:proline dehydrogenase
MEDSSVTEQTINLCNAMKELKLNNTGIALQSNLFRTPKDLLKLTENKVSIRLVKGAYVENQEIAHQKDFEIGAAFFDCAAHLYSHKAHKPAIATHDEELLEDIEELIPQPNYFEYELLYGIRRDLQEELKNKGYTVRIYVPFGKDWLPYTTRRLKEWKNLKFVIRNIFKEWKK